MLDPFSKKLFSSAHTSISNGGRGPLILMYHGTPTVKNRDTSIYCVTADNFQRQLDLLKDQGWTTKCIADLPNIDSFPDKTVILTFDDGYLDNYTGAYLPLLERDMTATWYIVSNLIGNKADWLKSSSSETAMLDKNQLMKMAQSGMEIGSHTLSHADLSKISSARQKNEIMDSKKQLEDLLSLSVKSFAYPYGQYDDSSLEYVQQAGYQFACTVRPGWFNNEKNPLLLRRICINLDDSLSTFSRKLAFADCDVSWKKMTHYSLSRIRSKFSGNP